MSTNPYHVNPLHCAGVSEQCPLKASIYGYYPSLGWNIAFAAVFATCFFINVWIGLRSRTWSYMGFMLAACVTACVGYVGRILMHDNPFNLAGFRIQIITLTMSPAYNAAALYLILKHFVLQFGQECSRIRARYYTWIFIFADFNALSLVAAGGGIAGSAGDNASLRDVGDRLMIAGLSWQVLILLFFAAAVGDYFRRRLKTHPLPTQAQILLGNRNFWIFVTALLVVYTAIFIRCVYRVAEMAGGWRNPIMQNEALFIGLDSW